MVRRRRQGRAQHPHAFDSAFRASVTGILVYTLIIVLKAIAGQRPRRSGDADVGRLTKKGRITMRKKAKILLLFMGLGLLSLSFSTFAVAAPSEPVKVVNHKTKECAMIWTGDECETCVPTGDWEILKGDCPNGYSQLNDYVPNSCTFSGNPICCQNSPDLYPCQDSTANQNTKSTANQNTKYILPGLVIVAFISVILIVLRKRRVVRE